MGAFRSFVARFGPCSFNGLLNVCLLYTSPAPVNRLDRNTTGLVIFGKNSAALRELSAMLRGRDGIEKSYLTITSGHIKEPLRMLDSMTKDSQRNIVTVGAKDDGGKLMESYVEPDVYKRQEEVGLGYIKLGQPSTELSGGEAQRVKLATELSKRSTGKTLYILDEPTTGLHFADVDKLIAVLDKLVDAGNTVVVIEHNLDVIKRADHIIDLGPDGGDRGGNIVITGTPEEVAEYEKSYTGQFLKKLLK